MRRNKKWDGEQADQRPNQASHWFISHPCTHMPHQPHGESAYLDISARAWLLSQQTEDAVQHQLGLVSEQPSAPHAPHDSDDHATDALMMVYHAALNGPDQATHTRPDQRAIKRARLAMRRGLSPEEEDQGMTFLGHEPTHRNRDRPQHAMWHYGAAAAPQLQAEDTLPDEDIDLSEAAQLDRDLPDEAMQLEDGLPDQDHRRLPKDAVPLDDQLPDEAMQLEDGLPDQDHSRLPKEAVPLDDQLPDEAMQLEDGLPDQEHSRLPKEAMPLDDQLPDEAMPPDESPQHQSEQVSRELPNEHSQPGGALPDQAAPCVSMSPEDAADPRDNLRDVAMPLGSPSAVPSPESVQLVKSLAYFVCAMSIVLFGSCAHQLLPLLFAEQSTVQITITVQVTELILRSI